MFYDVVLLCTLVVTCIGTSGTTLSTEDCTLAPESLDEVGESASSLLQQSKSSLSKLENTVPNLCIHDKFVPELFVIGAQKSGTTSLSAELFNGSTDILSWGPDEETPGHMPPEIYWGPDEDTPGKVTKLSLAEIDRGWDWSLLLKKEIHFFDWGWPLQLNWQKPGMEDKFLRKGLYAIYKSCQQDRRVVALDMSPMMHSPYAAHRIAKTYGDLRKKLTVVVLLRDPLRRMQSGFYHSKNFNRRKDMKNLTFAQYVENVLRDPTYCQRRNLTESHFDEDAFCDTLYVDQLTEWMRQISGTQFIVAPFKLVTGVDNETATFADSLFAKLGIQRSVTLGAVHQGQQKKKTPIEQDLDANLTARIRSLLDEVAGAGAVGNLLSSAGANLYKFTGSPTNADDIQSWLENNW